MLSSGGTVLAMQEEEREGEGHTVPIRGLDGKTNVHPKTLSKSAKQKNGTCHHHRYTSATKSDSVDP
jgi:hypothetical protein